MGEIALKTSELWLIFSFSDLWLLAINFSGFCLRRNLILCSILDILGFGWVKSHEKWKSYGPFSVFPIFEHFQSIKFFLRRNFREHPNISAPSQLYKTYGFSDPTTCPLNRTLKMYDHREVPETSVCLDKCLYISPVTNCWRLKNYISFFFKKTYLQWRTQFWLAFFK